MSSRQDVRFDLVANAKDSLIHAVDHLVQAAPTPADLKVAVCDVARAVELLLKERLRREHPALVWDSIDKGRDSSAFSVGTDKAILRLERWAGVVLDKKDLATIGAARQLRNAIEHFEVSLEEQEARGIVGRLLAFVFDFSEEHLDLDLKAEFQADDRWQALLDFYEFWEAHAEDVEGHLSTADGYIVQCPSCYRYTMDLYLGRCRLCDHPQEFAECARCSELVPVEEAVGGFDIDEDGNEISAYFCRDCDREMSDDYYEFLAEDYEMEMRRAYPESLADDWERQAREALPQDDGQRI